MSKRFRASALLVLACSALVVLAETRSASVDEIITFEKARLAAFAQADKPTFDRMMADDATITHSSGGVSNKADLIGVMRPSTPEQPLLALTIKEPKARVYGDAAVLSGKLVETASDGGREVVLRFTNTYARKEGRWQMVAGQLTKVPREEGAN